MGVVEFGRNAAPPRCLGTGMRISEAGIWRDVVQAEPVRLRRSFSRKICHVVRSFCPSLMYSSRMMSKSVWVVVVVAAVWCGTRDFCGKGGGDGGDDDGGAGGPRTASRVRPAKELLRFFNADI